MKQRIQVIRMDRDYRLKNAYYIEDNESDEMLFKVYDKENGYIGSWYKDRFKLIKKIKMRGI